MIDSQQEYLEWLLEKDEGELLYQIAKSTVVDYWKQWEEYNNSNELIEYWIDEDGIEYTISYQACRLSAPQPPRKRRKEPPKIKIPRRRKKRSAEWEDREKITKEELVTEKEKLLLLPFMSEIMVDIYQIRLLIYHDLCDAVTRKPNAWAEDLMGGRIKDIVSGIAIVASGEYGIALSIAIPVAIYFCKKGLHNFCASTPIGIS